MKFVDSAQENVKLYNRLQEQSAIRNLRQDEAEVWYNGWSNDIIYFYLTRINQYVGDLKELNSRNYFWIQSQGDADTKKTHSGLPKAMIETLVNILGVPRISVNSNEAQDGNLKRQMDDYNTTRLNEILKESNFFQLYKKYYVPYELVIGDGVFLPIITHDSKHPLLDFFDGRDVDIEYEGTKIKSITVKRYYENNGLFYVLLERRSNFKRNSIDYASFEYRLFQLRDKIAREVIAQVPLDTLEETKNLKDGAIAGFDKPLAIPVTWQYDAKTKRGVSLFAGKIDLFDDLDQCLSQRAMCDRYSTPIEYVDESLTSYDDEGKPIPFPTFSRKFITTHASKDTTRENYQPVVTSQPSLNFDQYSTEALELESEILEGIISPASMGLMLARNETAVAQREKEKITFNTRDALIDSESVSLGGLGNILLQLDDYMHGVTGKTYEVSIDYPEYANPTFDAKLQALQGPYASGMISPEQLVNEVWEDSLDDEEKAKEIEYLKSLKEVTTDAADPFALGEVS